jgi:hypothetical protein
LEKLKINSYGVDITTLEEVFLRIGHGDNYDDKLNKLNQKKKFVNNDYSVADNNESKLTT